MKENTNQDISSNTENKYWAFISYRHADNTKQDRDWASWLHKSIETYEVPAELIGTINDRGDEIPERIYPVFRDEVSLPADADLENSIVHALDNSLFLVALCSPSAVESKYVAQEIEHFKNTGKENRIIAGIIAGDPGHPQKECFPEPLREIVNKDGKLSEPIAADFRLPDGNEGYTSPEAYKKHLLKTLPKKEASKLADKYDERLQLMKLKIIAGILGKPLETIRNRDKAYQLAKAKRRQLLLTVVVFTVSTLALVAAYAGVLAWEKKLDAEKAELKAVASEKRTTNALQGEKNAKIEAQTERDKAIQFASEAERNAATAKRAESETRRKTSLAASTVSNELLTQNRSSRALAHAIRAYDLDPTNQRAPLLIHRLLSDGTVVQPDIITKLPAPYNCSVFSKDGKKFAVGCTSGDFIVVDIPSNEVKQAKLPSASKIQHLAFDPTGTFLAIGSRSGVYSWSIQNEAVETVSKNIYLDVLALSWPLSNTIVFTTGRDWGSYDRSTQVLYRITDSWKMWFGVGDSVPGGPGEEGCLDHAKVETINSSVSWYLPDPNIVFWKPEEDSLSYVEIPASPKQEALISTVSLSGDVKAVPTASSKILVEDRNGLFAFDFDSKSTSEVKIPSTSIYKEISDDGKFIISTNEWGGIFTDLINGIIIREHWWSYDGGRNLISVHPSGNLYAVEKEVSGDDSALIVAIDSPNGLLTQTISFQGDLLSCEFDSSGKKIAATTSDRVVRVWDCKRVLRGPFSVPSTIPVTYDRPETEDIVTGGNSDIWQISKEKKFFFNSSKITKFKNKIGDKMQTGTAFFPEEEKVVVTFGETSTRPDNNQPSATLVFSKEAGFEPISPLLEHPDDVFSPVVDPNGEWFSTCCDDGKIRFWSAKTYELLHAVDVGQPVRKAFVSPRGDLLISENGVCLSPDNGEQLGTLQLLGVKIEQVFFDYDRDLLISLSRGYQKRQKSSAANKPRYVALREFDLSNLGQIGGQIEVQLNGNSYSNPGIWENNPPFLLEENETRFAWDFDGDYADFHPLVKKIAPSLLNEAGEVRPNFDATTTRLKEQYTQFSKSLDESTAEFFRKLTDVESH